MNNRDKDKRDRTTGTGQPYQDSHDRTAGTGQPGQDSRDRTAGTRDRTAETGQHGQVRSDWSAKAENRFNKLKLSLIAAKFHELFPKNVRKMNLSTKFLTLLES